MKMIALVAALAVTIPAVASAQRSNNVRGYVKKDGTYVAPHYRTNPDRSIYNNWSTRPNVNPYTGRIGQVDPYATQTYRPYSAPSRPTWQRGAPDTSSSYKPYNPFGDSDD